LKKISPYYQLVIFVFLSLATHAQLPVYANGWTAFTPTNDSRIIYLSSSSDLRALNLSQGIYYMDVLSDNKTIRRKISLLE